MAVDVFFVEDPPEELVRVEVGVVVRAGEVLLVLVTVGVLVAVEVAVGVGRHGLQGIAEIGPFRIEFPLVSISSSLYQ